METDSITVRCALTLIAITRPGISKRCERCGKEFLNEHIETAEEDTISTNHKYGIYQDLTVRQPSLACWLFKKFDVCPYCGGKYVG